MNDYSAGADFVPPHEEEMRTIRSAILSHSPVRDCFIVSRSVGNGVAGLVAYVVADAPLDEAALADFVRARLPAEMPSLTVVTVSSLPATPDIVDFNAAGVAVLDDELVSTCVPSHWR